MMDESEHFTIKDLIFNGNQDPDSPAIESPGYQPLTYRDLRAQITYVVKTLNAMGFRPNDRIAIIMPSGPETAVATVSVMAGFTAVPLNLHYKDQEFEQYFFHLRIKAILVQKGTDTEAIPVAQSRHVSVIEIVSGPCKAGTFTLNPEMNAGEQEPVFAAPTDIASIMLTSGTTVLPKFVPFTQKRLLLTMQTYCKYLNIADKEKNLYFLPMDTQMGIGTLFFTLISGGCVICQKNFIAADFIRLLTGFRPNYYFAGPAHHRAILQEIKKVPKDSLKANSLRYIVTGSATLSDEVHDELEIYLGVPVIEIMAMTEAAFISLNVPYRKGSVGIPVIEHLQIRDDNNTPLKPGETGEIVLKGGLVFDGYENAPDENTAAFADGWFRTGDLGYFDDQGYLFLTGRAREMINKGGRKISPAEIDAVLLSHPDIRDAMAFRIPDAFSGEDIAAMVVRANENVSEEELRWYLLDHLIQFKVPRRIYFVDEIPRGPLGKPLREEGTRRYEKEIGITDRNAKKADENNLPGLSLNQQKLTRIWNDSLDIQNLSPDDDFFRCGGNSLTAIELLIKIQRTFHINFPPDTIYRYPTIHKQALLVTRKAGNTVEYHPLIVPIRGEGLLPPLFCVHPLGGWMNHYAQLSLSIDKKRPIFGIRARGLEPAETLPLTVEDTVKEQIDAVKSVQNEGPYHLLGFSNGGIIAYELACQLSERGEQVPFLGIIDVSAPAPEVRFLRTLTTILFPGRLLGRIPAFVESRLKADPESKLYLIISKSVRLVFHHLLYRSGSKSLPASVSDVHFNANLREDSLARFPKESHSHMKTQLKASLTYLPHTFPGDITLFSTGPDPILFPGDVTRGWRTYNTGKTVVIDVPGDHSTLFDDSNIGILAKKINEHLVLTDEHI